MGGRRQNFDFPADLVAESKDETFAFIEKLWAMRRVGEIIDELDLKGKNDELVKELVALATRHGILTPAGGLSGPRAAGRPGRALGGPVPSATPAAALSEAESFDEPLSAAADAVRNIGSKSFYRRGKRWVDSSATEEQDKQARRVKQFSDEYFRLADHYGRVLAQYLVFDEPELVVVDGEAYIIEPG